MLGFAKNLTRFSPARRLPALGGLTIAGTCSRVPFFLLSLFLLLLTAVPAPAQYNGSFSLTTVEGVLANAATCTGTAQNFITGNPAIPQFINLGQTSHLATATSNASQFQMEIDGLDAVGNAYRLSDLQLGVPNTAKGGLVVSASGYMPRIQVSVTCTAGATFTVSYSGSFSPQPPNIAGALLTAVEKLPFQTSAANANATSTFQTPGGNSQGTIVFQYSAAGPAGSSIGVSCITNGGTPLASFNFVLTTTANPQLFTVTQATCPFVTLTYVSGGASAVTYNLEYAFNVQSTQQTLSSANSGPSATTPIQVVSDSVSQSYLGGNSIANPTTAEIILQLNPNGTAKTDYLNNFTVSCTAACVLQIASTSTNGVGCTPDVPLNEKIGSGVANTAVLNSATGCSTQPTLSQSITGFALSANTPYTIDLRGVILPSGATNGFALILQTGFTGQINALINWYEK